MFIKKKDKRTKGCWNPECVNHKKHVKFPAADNYCPRCRSELVYVCARCGGRLEDINRKHRICFKCEERRESNAENRKAAVTNVMSAAAAVGTAAADIISKRKAK